MDKINYAEIINKVKANLSKYDFTEHISIYEILKEYNKSIEPSSELNYSQNYKEKFGFNHEKVIDNLKDKFKDLKNPNKKFFVNSATLCNVTKYLYCYKDILDLTKYKLMLDY